MTQDEVIEMAKEAEGVFYVTSGNQTPTWYFPHSTIYDFVNLVAAKEREACAKVVDEFNFGQAPMMIQRAIRARGEQA